MEQKEKDLVIIGTGPAGLSAAIYASRYKIDFIAIGKEIGGRVNETHLIENYPGFASISGFELGQKMAQHARSLGAEIAQQIVNEVKRDGETFLVTIGQEIYKARNLIFALGSEYRRLKIPGEEEFRGKGVSYCATCDGPFFRGKRVAVVGGGNSAASAAMLLSEYASQVIIFYRGADLKIFPSQLEQLKKNEKVVIKCCANLKEIKGDQVVRSLVLDVPFEDSTEVAMDGVFIEIGSEPSAELLMPLGVELDERQFIKTKPDQSTNVKGVFAAGDLTTNSNGFRQIVTAASEGAIAALSVYERIKADNAAAKQ